MREIFTTIHFCVQEFFENPAFRADGLKIYPTLVIRGTGELVHSHCSDPPHTHLLNSTPFNQDIIYGPLEQDVV